MNDYHTIKVKNNSDESIVVHGPAFMVDLIDKVMQKQAIEEANRKFPPNTKVKFTGTIHQLAMFIDSEHPDLDGAKAIMYDGGTGIVIGSHDFPDAGICYDVEFGDTGYHWHIIPEDYLDFA